MRLILTLLLAGTSSFTFAQTFEMPGISVLDGREEISEPGSLQKIRSERLKEKQATDPHEVLNEVSGLYVREEDGFGLRPNIGLRGTHSNRSSKITLLEDGVMIAPAPYSAPAAYYFPLMQKIHSVEVFKGPATLQYGPNSIGGAINFITRPFDKDHGQVSVRYGSFNTIQVGARQSLEGERWSLLLEGHRWQSDGFKTLPNGGETGFYRNDLMAKARYKLTSDGRHVIDYKFNWADEESNETYLGTTIADFNNDPFERYAASAEDLMEFDFWSHEARLFSQWGEAATTQLTVYRHDLTRTWAKFDRFEDSNIDTQNVLLNPTGANEDYYLVLRGERDSLASERLRFGINARDYYSKGIQFESDVSLAKSEDGTSRVNFEFGALLHQDQIDRNHTAQLYDMVGGQIQFFGDEFIDAANQELDRSDVFRGFGVLSFENERITSRLGYRYESVTSFRDDKLGAEDSLVRQDDIWIPGWGMSYALSDTQFVFVGVHKAITLPGPGEVGQVEPEEAINYEIGYRTNTPVFFELIGFYNDYENLLGTCTFSGGCLNTDLDTQFNSGKVEIFGVESQIGGEWVRKGYKIPFQATATYTEATFASSIQSFNKIWGVGQIKDGDPLPYIPKWKVNIGTGIKREKWRALLDFNYQSLMFDQAVASGRQEVDAYWTLNASGFYQFSKRLEGSLKINNVTNEQYIVSLRPFGARPGAPFFAMAGLTYSY